MTRKVLGYSGLLLVLAAVAVFIESSRERRYESDVARLKGTVIAKRIRPVQRAKFYGVTYRVTVQGRTLEREGDVGSQAAWDAMRIGDEVDVESAGATPNETRLTAERVAGSTAYFWIAGGLGIAGVVLLGLRIRGGLRGNVSPAGTKG